MKLATWLEGAIYHWCPACLDLHPIPHNGWQRKGTDDAPTFTPSFGQNTSRGRCHYIITAGNLIFQNDCFHDVRGTVPMPDVPQHVIDDLRAWVFHEAPGSPR
jgi:hypothetical protein